MNAIQKMGHWGDMHHPKWFDIFRIALGVVLLAKGFAFINNMDAISNLMSKSAFLGSISLGVMGHYIVFAHLVGGALLVFGLLTRLACLVQIPILLGAVIFINAPGGILQPHSELWLSILILVLLVFFLVEGSGPWSVDEWMRRNPGKQAAM